jgi:protein SCO1/2
MFLFSVTSGLYAGNVCAAAGFVIEPPKTIGVQVLVNQDGGASAFPGKHGRWQLAFFGYTNCPDVCPATMHKVAQLTERLGPAANALEPVFISIDSERDRPQALRKFIVDHGGHVTGLTGDPEQVQALANEFGVLTRKHQGKTALAYTMQHSAFIYLLDPQGRVRLLYSGVEDVASIERDIRSLWGRPIPVQHSADEIRVGDGER